MHIKTLLSFLTISFLLSPLLAQTNSVDSTAGYLDTKISETGTQINNGLDDTSKLFSRLIEFDNTELLYSSLLITGIAASFSLDNDVRKLSSRNQNSTAKSITDIGEKYGRILYAAILSTGLFTTGILTENKQIETTGRILFEGLLISGMTAEIIKIAAGRSRPFTNEPSSTFNFFKTDNPHNSFPSGHTVVAFTTSSVLAASIKNVYISIALYSLAGLTAYQRIYSDNHWFSDTIFSAVLGTTVGNMLVLINDERGNEPPDQKVNFNFAPALFPEGLGINVMITF